MSYKSFKETDRIDEALARNDMVGVRELLCVACKVDRSFNMFNDGLNYVQKEKGRTDLFEPKLDENRALYADRVNAKDPTLSAADYSDALFDLSRNFHQDRIKDVIILANYLKEKDGKNGTAQSAAQSVSVNPTMPAQEKRKSLLPVVIAIGVLVVIGVILVLVLRQVK